MTATTRSSSPPRGWSWLLDLIPGVVAWFRPRLAWVLGLVVVVPQVVAAGVTVSRYVASGWGSGLEIFAFLAPLAMASLIVVEVLDLTTARRRRRAR